MKIAVCMKQVPAVMEGSMDKETGVLIRTGLAAEVNVYDLAALEAALGLKERYGGEIHVFTMGPDKAEEVLRSAFAMGADEGYLVCDRLFAGADVLTTSYTLMQAIKAVGEYDIILCGKQTTDGDTAQVSGALAKWMELPHVNWVLGIGRIADGRAAVQYAMEKRTVYAEVPLPCLLSVERDSFPPRMPSLKLKISGRKKIVHMLTIDDFNDKCGEHYGLEGSATRVKKIFPPEFAKKCEPVNTDKKEAAKYIFHVLCRKEGGGSI